MSIPGDPQAWRVGLVGYGEVGRILAEDLRKQGVAVAAYDIKLGTGCAMRRSASMRRSTTSLSRPRMPSSHRTPTSSSRR